jgi:hypothetical protein
MNINFKKAVILIMCILISTSVALAGPKGKEKDKDEGYYSGGHGSGITFWSTEGVSRLDWQSEEATYRPVLKNSCDATGICRPASKRNSIHFPLNWNGACRPLVRVWSGE